MKAKEGIVLDREGNVLARPTQSNDDRADGQHGPRVWVWKSTNRSLLPLLILMGIVLFPLTLLFGVLFFVLMLLRGLIRLFR